MGLSGPLIISLLKQNSFLQLSMLPLHHWMKREGVVQHPVTSRANRYFPSLVVFRECTGRCAIGVLQVWRQDWDSLRLFFRCATSVYRLSFRRSCLGGERKATEFKYVVESLVRGATKVKRISIAADKRNLHSERGVPTQVG